MIHKLRSKALSIISIGIVQRNKTITITCIILQNLNIKLNH